MKVIWLKKEDFFKNQKGIESENRKNPTDKIIVMVLDYLNPQSPRASILLKDYYRKLEKNPRYGLSQSELSLLVKNNLMEDNHFKCSYCEKNYPAAGVTIDHFKPQMFKGKNHFSNLKLSCFKCNTMKGAIHPERMPNVFKLFKDKAESLHHSSCLELLWEAKRKFYHLDFVETKLIDRLINTEVFWREKNGKPVKEEDFQSNQELSPNILSCF